MCSAPEIRLEHMTSPEIGVEMTAGSRSVVLACGAVEQHGPHLPLGVDSLHADRLALLVAERLEHTLVAPTLRIGCSPHHLAFPGTLSLSADTFRELYLDCCASLASHGFNRILVFSGHIGNYPVLKRIAPLLQQHVGQGCEVDVFTEEDQILAAWRESVEAATGLGDRVGGHADIAESSVMLALDPASVRWDAVAPGAPATAAANLEIVFRDGLKAITPTGVLGDPRGMSAALGERVISATADVLVAHFEGRSGEHSC